MGFIWIKPTFSDRSKRERRAYDIEKEGGMERREKGDVTHKGIVSKLQISGIAIGNREKVFE